MDEEERFPLVLRTSQNIKYPTALRNFNILGVSLWLVSSLMASPYPVLTDLTGVIKSQYEDQTLDRLSNSVPYWTIVAIQ